MSTVDETDRAILEVLKDKARLSTRQIAKLSGIPFATVHKRMKKMEEEGVIEGYAALVNKEKLGKNTLAYILVRLQPGQEYTDLMKQMSKREEIEEIGALAGQFDIVLKTRVGSVGELDNFVMQYIRKFPEVMQTQTLVVFRHWH